MLTTAVEIERFLEEYSRSRVIIESTVRATLNRALEFEKKFQKTFYQFTIDEIIEMYKSIHAISDRSLQNTNLTLKHAARWIIDSKDLNFHSQYENMTNQEILDRIKKFKVTETPDVNNRKRLVRLLNKVENNEDLSHNKDELLYDIKTIGLTTDREVLYERINNRVDIMLENGLIEEALNIYNTNIRSKAVLTPIGYKELIEYLKCIVIF